MKLFLLTFLLLVSYNANAYNWWTRAPIWSTNVTWLYNPDACNDANVSPFEEVKATFDLWDRLLDTVSINYGGETSQEYDNSDEVSVVSCMNNTNYALARPTNPRSLAFTDVRTTINSIISADIVFKSTNPVCPPHEVTHALGLDHSTDPQSLVHRDPDTGLSNCLQDPLNYPPEYPSNDDLVGMSRLYMQAANCIPFMSKTTGRLYLPYVDGYWAVLQHMGDYTFEVVDYGEALDFSYSCDVGYSYGAISEGGENVEKISGVVYYQGEEIDFTLININGLWTAT